MDIKDVKFDISVKPTIHWWFAVRIYAPFLISLGLYDQLDNLVSAIKADISKYFKCKVILIRKEEELKNEENN